MSEKVQLVMLGSGREDLEQALRDMENRYVRLAAGGLGGGRRGWGCTRRVGAGTWDLP
jgi:hypothetical protein